MAVDNTRKYLRFLRKRCSPLMMIFFAAFIVMLIGFAFSSKIIAVAAGFIVFVYILFILVWLWLNAPH